MVETSKLYNRVFSIFLHVVTKKTADALPVLPDLVTTILPLSLFPSFFLCMIRIEKTRLYSTGLKNSAFQVEEYNLGGSVPALVYFRYTTPAVYQGDLTDEHAVLEWLIHNR